jgi:hypothetical protein
VALVQPGQGGVVDRFQRRGHEQAPEGGQLRPEGVVAQHVLHLDGQIEGQVGEGVVEGPHDPAGVLGPVEEVGVTEGDVAGARRHQLVHVGQDHLLVDRPGPALVDDRHRAVPAPVRAAVGGLDVAHQAVVVADRQVGVAVEGGQQVAGGQGEGAPAQLDRHRRRFPVLPRRSGRQAVHPCHQRRLVLPGDDPVGDRPHREVPAHRGVEPVEAHGDPRS